MRPKIKSKQMIMKRDDKCRSTNLAGDNSTPLHQLGKPENQNQADRSRRQHIDLKADSQEKAQSKWSTEPESQPENLREPIHRHK
jgi:hypothetical protein